MSTEYKTLQDISLKVTDGSHGTPKFVDKGYPFITVKGVEHDHIDFTNCDFISREDYLKLRGNCNPVKGDILFSKDGTVGKVVGIDEDREFIVLSSLAIIRPNPAIVDQKYLKYFLRSEECLSQALHMKTGSAIRRIIVRDIKRIKVPILPLYQQRRIGRILQRTDDLLRKRQRADQIASKIIQSVFLKMFGDPATNPRNWSITSIGSIIRDGPQNGLYKPSSFYGSGAPIVRINSFYDGVLFAHDLKNVRTTAQELKTYKLELGDILINRVNSPEFVGKCALVKELPQDTVFESNIMRFRLNTDMAVQEFIISFLLTGYAKAQILARSKRAVHQVSINQQDVRSIKLYLPPIEIQRKYAGVAKRVQALSDKQAASSEDINELFQSLLHEAFTGELPRRLLSKP